MRLKRHFLVIFLVSTLFIFGGCGDKSVSEISDGTYTMVTTDEEAFAPSITFNLDDNTFRFTYDLFSSYLNIGTIDVSDGKVICTTDDEQFTFVFKIIDNDILEFLAEESSAVKTVDGYDAVLDQAEFKYVGEPVG